VVSRARVREDRLRDPRRRPARCRSPSCWAARRAARRGAGHRLGIDYLQCVFQPSGEPDCHGYTALGRSLLRFHGMDLVGAIGRFKDAKIISSKEVKGGNDFIVELTRR
jgi:hypothetical protein